MTIFQKAENVGFQLTWLGNDQWNLKLNSWQVLKITGNHKFVEKMINKYSNKN